MFGYIYKTTNILNNMIYIGKHKWDSLELDSTYLGSGIYLKRAIEKYGKENFTCEILDYAETLQELNDKEKLYIEKFNSMNSNIGYNLTRGGDGTYLPGVCLGRSWDPIVQDKIRKTVKQLWSDPNSIYNSDLYRTKLSTSCSQSHQNNKRKDVYHKISIAKMGHIVSDETKLKISNTLKQDSEINRTARKINTEKHKNKMWINNGEQQLFIKSDIAQHYLEQGWIRGRLPYSEETLNNMKIANQKAALKRKTAFNEGKQQEVEMRVKHTGVSVE